jgi:hypothetical protein
MQSRPLTTCYLPPLAPLRRRPSFLRQQLRWWLNTFLLPVVGR